MEVALVFVSERPTIPVFGLFLHVSVPWKIYLGDFIIIIIIREFSIKLGSFFKCQFKYN